MTLFGNGFIADVIKLKLVYIGIRQISNKKKNVVSLLKKMPFEEKKTNVEERYCEDTRKNAIYQELQRLQ